MEKGGCKYFKKCGACQLRNLSYKEQLSYKMSRIIKTLGRFCHVHEIVPMENTEGYRNKAQAIVFPQGGKAVSGIYKSSSGTAVKCDFCAIETKTASEIIRVVINIANDINVTTNWIPLGCNDGKPFKGTIEGNQTNNQNQNCFLPLLQFLTVRYVQSYKAPRKRPYHTCLIEHRWLKRNKRNSKTKIVGKM